MYSQGRAVLNEDICGKGLMASHGERERGFQRLPLSLFPHVPRCPLAKLRPLLPHCRHRPSARPRRAYRGAKQVIPLLGTSASVLHLGSQSLHR